MANSSTKKLDKPVVLYDGSCPVCSREIAHYRRRREAGNIVWIDASKDLVNLDSLGISQQQAMSTFHARDEHGVWQTGVDAFLLIWSTLPAYRWLARLVDFFRLRPLLAWGYQYFLKWRQRCDDQSQCSTTVRQD